MRISRPLPRLPVTSGLAPHQRQDRREGSYQTGCRTLAPFRRVQSDCMTTTLSLSGSVARTHHLDEKATTMIKTIKSSHHVRLKPTKSARPRRSGRKSCQCRPRSSVASVSSSPSGPTTWRSSTMRARWGLDGSWSVVRVSSRGGAHWFVSSVGSRLVFLHAQRCAGESRRHISKPTRAGVVLRSTGSG